MKEPLKLPLGKVGTRKSDGVMIDKITIIGNRKTKLSYFEAAFCHISNHSHDIQSLLSELSRITNNIQSHGIFESVDTQIRVIDRHNHILTTEVIVNVKEANIPFLKMSSFVRTGSTGSSSSNSDIGGEIEGTTLHQSPSL
jgi:hypothetical protein